jgi:hypothetical protein
MMTKTPLRFAARMVSLTAILAYTRHCIAAASLKEPVAAMVGNAMNPPGCESNSAARP